jgi:hypothetical protein
VEHDHYPHTMLEPMDRDPIAWKKSLEFERYLAECGASKPWQIFKAASEFSKESSKTRGVEETPDASTVKSHACLNGRDASANGGEPSIP